jgi:LacI family transcriptional regulator
VTVTRLDVARAAGVSPAVVSYVINNGPRRVSPKRRAAVEKAIDALGYRPNAIASALRAGATQTIGFLTPNSRDPYSATLADAVERHLRGHGYLMLTGSTHFDRSQEDRHLKSFLERNVDGLIVDAGVSLADAPLCVGGRPVVCFEDSALTDGRSVVATLDAVDAAHATEHLQRHGHRLIACIAGPAHIGSVAARVAGWRAQQAAASLPGDDELLAHADLSEQGGDFAALQLLSRHGRPAARFSRPPRALFVASDLQAVGAIYACFELGLRVPDDVAIVSIGGTPSASFTVPPLTTMRQDVEFIAATAVAHLIARIEAPDEVAPLHVRLAGNLVVADSCGCAGSMRL